MPMATVGISGINIPKSRTMSSLSSQMADIMSKNSDALAAGNKINTARGASIAGAAQALANQTGGNIMGFTYE